VHDIREHPQHFRLADATLDELDAGAVHVHRADGPKHRVQRSADIVVRGRDNRAPAQGIVVVVGVHGGHVRRTDDVPVGIPVRLENRRVAEYAVSDLLRVPRRVCTWS